MFARTACFLVAGVLGAGLLLVTVAPASALAPTVTTETDATVPTAGGSIGGLVNPTDPNILPIPPAPLPGEWDYKCWNIATGAAPSWDPYNHVSWNVFTAWLLTDTIIDGILD